MAEQIIIIIITITTAGEQNREGRLILGAKFSLSALLNLRDNVSKAGIAWHWENSSSI